MSLWSKVKKVVAKGAKYLPGLAAAVPSSKALANAAQALQAGQSLATGGIAALPGVLAGAGPVALPKSPAAGVMPVSLQAGNFPALPSFPGGGIVKTGLPVAAVAAGTALMRAAPAVVAGGRALLARISPKVAKALGWATVGGLVYDATGNLMGQTKRRQMNPLNPRAAKRAIRRVKAVRKLCHNLERALPKQKAPRYTFNRSKSCR